MNNKFLLAFIGAAMMTALFSKNLNMRTKQPIEIQIGNDSPTLVRTNNFYVPSNREQIDLITDDFEGDVSAWNASPGWQLTNTSFNSETYSFWSPDELFLDDSGTAIYKSWDLFSPTYTLPILGEGETMHFGFHLNIDMPDTNQEDDPTTPDDESTFLADYYNISIMDVADIAWQISSFNAYQGSSYWCGKDDVGNGTGGYLDAWVQYLDTPQFTVPANGSLTADMFWALETFDNVSGVSGTCVGGGNIDGWDQANVQISSDGGNTFTVINGSVPYDFSCGYGMVYNGFDGAPGWGGSSPWTNVSFDLSAYSGQDVVVRFAFYSDPAASTLDDATWTGFQVDNVLVSSGVFSDDAEGEELMTASGAVWVDQFYDYYDAGDATYDPRPGSNGWEEYQQGFPFNGNVFLDISDFQGKEVMFRFQTRYDEDHSGGQGQGLFIDDFRVYKVSGGNYPAPTNLVGESGDNEVLLSWNDMNFSGVVDYQYDNDTFSENDGIIINGDGFAWAGLRVDAAGDSDIQSLSVFNINPPGTEVQIGVFGTFGTLFSPDVLYSQTVTLDAAGWNTFNVDWQMSGPFIVGHTFDAVNSAVLDVTVAPSTNSMTLLSGTWDVWNDIATSNGLTDGEWGIRTTVNQQGANVTYNVYRDAVSVGSSFSDNSFTDTGAVNNTTYLYEVTATYPDGEESGPSNGVEVTPQAQTVYEVSYDDGTSELGYSIGSSNFLAVKYNASSVADVVRFKWYQETSGGAFYIKMFEDVAGLPGSETFSRVVAGGLTQGWNEFDLLSDNLQVNGDFWIGIKAFSSTSSIGIDNSSSGNSYTSQGTSGVWDSLDGNAMIRLLLDGEGGGQSCTPGDVNADDFINVLDIVSIVNFIMNTTTPNDDEQCAADYNGDNTINVLDIVNIVNIILGD